MLFFLAGARGPTEEDRQITEKQLVPEGPGLGPVNDWSGNGSGDVLRLKVQTDDPLQVMPSASKPARNIPPPKFRTSLQLTPEQVERLVSRAIRRIDELKREMGLDVNGAVMPNTWMGIRKRNLDSYEGDYTWRLALGGIFGKSNFSVGTNTRHTRYLAARVQDDLLGTNPFFGAISSKGDKAKLAKQVEQIIQDAIEETRVARGLRESQKIALVVNEATVKTVWRRDASKFKGPGEVMVNELGEPILTPDKKLYVFRNDNFLPHPAVDNLSLLEKDPSFAMREGQFGFREFPDLEQEAVRFEGVSVQTIDFRCFLCPLRMADIHEADINVHLYKEDPENLRGIYDGIDVSDQYFGWWEQTGDQTPRTVHGEYDDHVSAIVRKITIAETYIRFDANQDGDAEEILLVLDLENRKPVFYDYLHNHFKKRPFEIVPGLEFVFGRWYGRGIYSLGEDQELHIDAEFNRAQIKGSRSSSITFRQKAAVDEWNQGLPTVIGTDDVFNLNPGFDPTKNPPIFKTNLAEDNEKALELMEIMRQSSDGLIGAISLQDASQSDMNQSETATGIVNLQQASDVITKATEKDQGDGLERVLDQVATLVLEKMDTQTLVFDPKGTELALINRNEARSLQKDVRLFLTRSRSTQLLQTSQQALVVAKDYRAMMLQDPEGAAGMRDLYISQLKGLEVNNADEICPEITPEYIAQFKAQQAMAAQAQLQSQQDGKQREQIKDQRDGEMHGAKLNKLKNDEQRTAIAA